MIELDPLDKDSGHVNAIIDTPKGSRNKFKYDEKIGMFKLGGSLPLGAVFPFDFGYIPSTKAEDGDSLDILILMYGQSAACRWRMLHDYFGEELQAEAMRHVRQLSSSARRTIWIVRSRKVSWCIGLKQTHSYNR